MEKTITFKGQPLTLAGRSIQEGTRAPNFQAVSPDLNEAKLSDFPDKIKVITSFASIDTPVCDKQIRTFNEEASKVSDDVVIVGISKDLPFALKRFCEANGIKNAVVLSDYKTSSFGINYGLLIKELNLLARTIIIVDKNDVIRYIEIVDELTDHPNYDKALKALENVKKNPTQILKDEEKPQRCAPCEKGASPLVKEKISTLLKGHPDWALVEDKKIQKTFKFKNFLEAVDRVKLISIIAEEQRHHPNITILYNKLKITLTTHAVDGLTKNDFVMAGLLDDILADGRE